MDGSTTWNANPVIQEDSAKKKSRQQQIGKRKAVVEAWFSLDSEDEATGFTEVEPIDEEEIFG
jgi:hypothetical protein